MISPLQISLIFHSFILLFMGAVIWGNFKIKPQIVNVPVVFETIPETTQITTAPKVVLKSVNQEVSNKKVREVFGLNRNSYTGSGEAVAKMGNTLTKEMDNEKLKDSDVDSLPVPTEEYLVSTMPRVLVEVKPDYPPVAKAESKEGSVAMDILIDESGAVRKVDVISGDVVFRNDAVIAMKKFKFSPALVDGKPVPVKIRYVLKFVLEF